jgi:hypothetical protein
MDETTKKYRFLLPEGRQHRQYITGGASWAIADARKKTLRAVKKKEKSVHDKNFNVEKNETEAHLQRRKEAIVGWKSPVIQG